jgi:hypothetical protein
MLDGWQHGSRSALTPMQCGSSVRARRQAAHVQAGHGHGVLLQVLHDVVCDEVQRPLLEHTGTYGRKKQVCCDAWCGASCGSVILSTPGCGALQHTDARAPPPAGSKCTTPCPTCGVQQCNTTLLSWTTHNCAGTCCARSRAHGSTGIRYSHTGATW